MNTDLLISLYKVFSPSYGEKRMRKFIKRYARNIPGVSLYSDNGNLYITRGEADTYPCVVAHMDQVQSHSHSKDFDCIIHNDIVMGWSDSQKEQQGLGADDKNGIFVALECLAKYDTFKCAFFWGEEVGCNGSSRADMPFFKDVRFVLQCDRRGGYDFITSISSQIASDDFVKDCDIDLFGYHENYGAMTDVEQLSENGIGVSCVNMSCGYYHPHTDHEVTALSELENCLHLVEHIIENCTKVYEFDYDSQYGWRLSPCKSTKAASFFDVNDYYNEVFDCIDTILMNNPEMSLHDIITNYRDAIPVRDFDFIASVYQDVIDYYGSFEHFELDTTTECAEIGTNNTKENEKAIS